MLTEIDTRPILGNGGTIELLRWDDDLSRTTVGYVVKVNDPSGAEVAQVTAYDRAEARDAYLHPFARTDVPNVFIDTADVPADESD